MSVNVDNLAAAIESHDPATIDRLIDAAVMSASVNTPAHGEELAFTLHLTKCGHCCGKYLERLGETFDQLKQSGMEPDDPVLRSQELRACTVLSAVIRRIVFAMPTVSGRMRALTFALGCTIAESVHDQFKANIVDEDGATKLTARAVSISTGWLLQYVDTAWNQAEAFDAKKPT